jgi:hypothetical protein
MVAAVAAVAEDVRVPPLHFVGDGGSDSVESNAPASSAIRAWKTTWSSKSPSRPEAPHIAALTGVGDLIGFLDRIGAIEVKVWTLSIRSGDRIAQPRHDGAQAFDGGCGFGHWANDLPIISSEVESSVRGGRARFVACAAPVSRLRST